MKVFFKLWVCLTCFNACVSCSASETQADETYAIDTISSLLRANTDKTYIEIVLGDGRYTFPIADISEITITENTSLQQNRCVFSNLGLTSSGQSGVIINDTVINFNNGATATATSMATNEVTNFSPECTNYRPHCNVANYLHWNGKHYVYLSEWDGQHRCFVEELNYDVNAKVWHSQLVQIITMSISDDIRGIDNMDWIVDQENNMLYTQTCKDGTSENATGLIYMQFPLPSLDDNRNVTITDDQIIRRVEFPMIYISQDKFIYKGNMYIASGWGAGFPGKITVIRLSDFSVVDEYDLSARNDEPEMIDMYKDNLLVFYWTANYSVQNKKSIYIHFKNGICLSYPIVNIKEFNFY